MMSDKDLCDRIEHWMNGIKNYNKHTIVKTDSESSLLNTCEFLTYQTHKSSENSSNDILLIPQNPNMSLFIQKDANLELKSNTSLTNVTTLSRESSALTIEVKSNSSLANVTTPSRGSSNESIELNVLDTSPTSVGCLNIPLKHPATKLPELRSTDVRALNPFKHPTLVGCRTDLHQGCRSV
jgi:hypothetical protein